MTKDKWSQSNQFHSNSKIIPMRKKLSNPEIDLDIDEIKLDDVIHLLTGIEMDEENLDHSIDDFIASIEKHQLDIANNIAETIAEQMSRNIYNKTHNSCVTELKNNSLVIKAELSTMFTELQESFNDMTNPKITENIIGYNSFDDFYTDFRNFTLLLNQKFTSDIEDLKLVAEKYKDDLKNKPLFIFLALHLVHQHRHKHIYNEIPKSMPCGHKVIISVEPNFCPTCGKPTKETP